MGWYPTRTSAVQRRSPLPSVHLFSTTTATLCMLVAATCLVMTTAEPLRPRHTRSSEYSSKYEDLDASDEEPYSFQYEVDAPYHGTWHDRQEVKSGKETEGRFRVALPDHRLQTVTYKATHAKGFEADVQFEQHPDFNALRGNIGKAPVIGTPVVPSAPHAPSGDHAPAKPQSPSYGYQIAVGNDYGKRRRRPSKAPAPAYEEPSSDNTSKYSSRPAASRRPSSSIRKRPSRPSSVAYERPSVVHERPSVVHDRPSVTYKRPSLEEPSSFSHHSSGSLSAFVSISPDIIKHTTSRPVHVNRPKAATSAPFSGYLPSPPSEGDKKVVPSRPLRTRQRTTIKPVHKPLDQGDSYRPPSFGDKQLSRPRPSEESLPPTPHSDSPKDVPILEGETVPHLPDKEEPIKKGMEPPATTDESFSVAGKPHRYSIRKEGMSSIRSRLNSIVHD